MKPLREIAKTTLIGGILFLLPLGIIVLVVSELVDLGMPFANKVNEVIIPGSDLPIVSTIIAVGLLVLVALAAGIISMTKFGNQIFEKTEDFGRSLIPGYGVAKQIISDMSGGASALGDPSNVRIVCVRQSGSSRFGFVVDSMEDGALVVYLPGSPSPLNGIVVVVESEEIEETSLSAAQVMKSMQLLGRGLGRPAV